MPGHDRKVLARQVYEAFAAADRDLIERLLADDFEFHSPPDPHLDRAGYFERCWPHAGTGQSFDFVPPDRVRRRGLVVTYEGHRPERASDLQKHRGTDRFTGRTQLSTRAEVYFGIVRTCA